MEFEHKVGALDDEDLVVGDKEEKNWKGIVISLLVIGSILGAIIVAIILCTPTGDTDNNKMKLDFDHVVSDVFKEQAFNGTWLSDHEIVYVDQNGSIVIFDAKTNKSSSMLVKTYDKTLHTMAGFKLSSDRQSILFVSDMRHEFGAPVSVRYAIFNISSQTVEFLDDLIKANYVMKNPHIQYASWGPSASSIIFIESNDIYYVPEFSRSNSIGGKYVRISKTGELSESISNGLPDSLYRYNIFDRANEACLWWSGDGRYLAYLSFDDALVEATPIEFYDSYDSSSNPRIHFERYPRAGSVIPRVTVHVVDLVASQNSDGTESSFQLIPPVELVKQKELDSRLGHYVTHVEWLPNGGHQLLVMWASRAQNSSILTQCDLVGRSGNSWRCNLLTSFSQRIPPSRDAKKTILSAFNTNGSRLLFFALPRPDSVIGEHFHVAMLLNEERAPKYLTYGQFDIDRLVSYDAKRDTLYFEVRVSEQAERHLYKMSFVSQVKSRQTKCLTCDLDESCGYNYVHISPGSSYLVHECLGPSIPVTRLRLLNSAHDKLPTQYVLNTNEVIENLVRTKQMPIIKFLSIKSNNQVPYDVHIKMYLPIEIEEEKDKRFPLLVESSEIDEHKVWKKFELDWGNYLASRKQLIYAKIDCIRSKPSQMSGSAFSHGAGGGGGGEHDEQLADPPLFNAKDQIDVIKFLVDNQDLFPYIDRRRVAIWGPSSTSAYVALATTINDDSKLIQCTVAVAPITNWRYMNAYTAEHYLGLPWLDSNSLKYERANLLKRNYEFSMRKVLIVHGTADEQVHVQNSMQFIKALTEHHMTGGVIHQMQLYPDVGHSLAQVKKHFYLTLDGFIDRCFYQKPIINKATEWKGKVRPKLY